MLIDYAESDIVYFNTAGTPVIILNTYEAANQLLERRSALYSHRPVFLFRQRYPSNHIAYP